MFGHSTRVNSTFNFLLRSSSGVVYFLDEALFLHRKTVEIGKIPSEVEILTFLKEGMINFSPFKIMVEAPSEAELAAIKEMLGVRASGTKVKPSAKLAERAVKTGKTDHSDRQHFSDPSMTTEEAHAAILAHDHTAPGALLKLASMLSHQLTGEQLVELKMRLGMKGSQGKMFDAFVLLTWGTKRYRFVAECKRLWTPKALTQQMDQVRRYARPPETYPLVVVPYLPDARLAELEAEGVSGIDLCGNGIITIPNELLVYRTGRPNRYRTQDEIKNVFRGSSSLVARAFLLMPEFESVQAAMREVEKRGGNVVLGTVSKVCKTLEGLLVIANTRVEGGAARQLKLLQADKLLDLLAANYVAPSVAEVVRGKTKLKPEAFRAALADVERDGLKVIRTGFGSVDEYAVMAKEPMQYFYTTDIDSAVRALGETFERTDRFANVTLSRTKDDTVYFDRRPGLVASPIQTYLELTAGDKRSQETAEQLRRTILATLARREG